MLAHTFDESPIFHSAFPVPERRSKASRAIFAAVLKDGMRFGRVQIARNPEIVGALIWYLPGCYPPGLVRKVRLLADYARVAAADLGGFIKVTRAEAIVAQLHPPEPHIYAYFIGVARGDQGRGVGKMLANYLVGEADRINLPIYLETQERSNVDWYKRLGCRILREGLALYPGGPPTWTMWRDIRHRQPPPESGAKD